MKTAIEISGNSPRSDISRQNCAGEINAHETRSFLFGSFCARNAPENRAFLIRPASQKKKTTGDKETHPKIARFFFFSGRLRAFFITYQNERTARDSFEAEGFKWRTRSFGQQQTKAIETHTIWSEALGHQVRRRDQEALQGWLQLRRDHGRSEERAWCRSQRSHCFPSQGKGGSHAQEGHIASGPSRKICSKPSSW